MPVLIQILLLFLVISIESMAKEEMTTLFREHADGITVSKFEVETWIVEAIEHIHKNLDNPGEDPKVRRLFEKIEEDPQGMNHLFTEMAHVQGARPILGELTN